MAVTGCTFKPGSPGGGTLSQNITLIQIKGSDAGSWKVAALSMSAAGPSDPAQPASAFGGGTATTFVPNNQVIAYLQTNPIYAVAIVAPDASKVVCTPGYSDSVAVVSTTTTTATVTSTPSPSVSVSVSPGPTVTVTPSPGDAGVTETVVATVLPTDGVALSSENVADLSAGPLLLLVLAVASFVMWAGGRSLIRRGGRE